MFHFTYTVVPQTVKYVLKSMFQAHVARFSGVPRAPFAAIGVGLTELCFYTSQTATVSQVCKRPHFAS